MNDLLILAVPFIAFVALFFAWFSQNRKAAPVRATQTVRPVSATVEAEHSGVQVPA